MMMMIGGWAEAPPNARSSCQSCHCPVGSAAAAASCHHHTQPVVPPHRVTPCAVTRTSTVWSCSSTGTASTTCAEKARATAGRGGRTGKPQAGRTSEACAHRRVLPAVAPVFVHARQPNATIAQPKRQVGLLLGGQAGHCPTACICRANEAHPMVSVVRPLTTTRPIPLTASRCRLLQPPLTQHRRRPVPCHLLQGHQHLVIVPAAAARGTRHAHARAQSRANP